MPESDVAAWLRTDLELLPVVVEVSLLADPYPLELGAEHTDMDSRLRDLDKELADAMLASSDVVEDFRAATAGS
jgi:hypothetical protein